MKTFKLMKVWNSFTQFLGIIMQKTSMVTFIPIRHVLFFSFTTRKDDKKMQA